MMIDDDDDVDDDDDDDDDWLNKSTGINYVCIISIN